jgi:5-methylcytosine-specific restriction endonuclease McrA
MKNNIDINTGIKLLFDGNLQKIEGKWYQINNKRIIRVCYSKAFVRPNYKRYFFGVQQEKYNQYRSRDLHILFVCGTFDQALLLPGTFLDRLLEKVPVANDNNWKFDIHQRGNHFEILVTGKERQDISKYLLGSTTTEIFQPTSNPPLLVERARLIRERGQVIRPKGNRTPRALKIPITRAYERLPAVRAWVLQEAKGICELCRQPGPFLLPNGEKFLELHHIKSLADGGPDIVENTVAVCPNCHRLLHFAIDAESAKNKLYKQVKRLVRI